MTPLVAGTVDLARYIRPGDRVVVGQGSAEPQRLARLLVEQRRRLGGVEVFVGPGFSEVFAGAETDGLAFQSYGALGSLARLAASGRLDVLAMPYGAMCAGFGSGVLRADVVMLQVAAMPGRGFSVGLSDDYAAAAARGRARVLLLEVNAGTPWTHGDAIGEDLAEVVCVAAEAPPLTLAEPVPDAVDRAIADRVAALVPERATVQMGVGTLPGAVMAALAGHSGLGIHSGVLGDAGRALVEAGVVTNAHKGVDEGVTVTNTVFGSRALYGWVHDNPAVQVRAGAYTHSLGVMARLRRFTAINGGIEVDLGGQVNTEVVPDGDGGRYIGALGGGLEFTRGAALSEGGRAIVALRSTARGGEVGRIVPRVAVATIPRGDVDTVVTEHGVAELRGVTLGVRARRLIGVAAPHLREGLARAAAEMEGCGRPSWN